MDQDDHDIPFEPPTAKTRYAMMLPGTDEQPFPRTLHLSGRCAKNGSITLVHLAKGAPDIDVYSGKGLRIVAGTGKGQSARIVSYDAVSKVCKMGAWAEPVPDKSSSYVVTTSPDDARVIELESNLKKLQLTAEAEVTLPPPPARSAARA